MNERTPEESDAQPGATGAGETETSLTPTAKLRLLQPKAVDGFIIALSVLAFLAALRATREFCLPVVIGVLLALLLDPAARACQRLGLPRPAAAALVMLTLVTLLGVGLRLTFTPAKEYLAGAPQKLHRVEHRLERLLRPVEEVSEAAKKVGKITEMSEGESVAVKSEPSFGKSLFDNTQRLVASLVASLTLGFFLLASSEQLVRRWADLLGDEDRFLRIARHIQRDVSGHLWTISLINAGLGVLVGLACWWSGLPNPVLWGLMATLFNYVPYLGAAAGVAVVTVVSIFTFDAPLDALRAPALYLLLTSLEGALLTPMILGRRFSLHPAIVFLGLLFWSYLWGVAGALLAVPMLLVFKIVCDNLPSLEKLGRAMAR